MNATKLAVYNVTACAATQKLQCCKRLPAPVLILAPDFSSRFPTAYSISSSLHLVYLKFMFALSSFYDVIYLTK